MDHIVDKIIKPLSILIIGSLIINLLGKLSFINSNALHILLVFMLFLFGMSLNLGGRFNFKYFSLTQLLIVALTVLLYLFQTGMWTVKLFRYFEKYTVSSDLLLNVLYIYFGWLFKGSR